MVAVFVIRITIFAQTDEGGTRLRELSARCGEMTQVAANGNLNAACL